MDQILELVRSTTAILVLTVFGLVMASVAFAMSIVAVRKSTQRLLTDVDYLGDEKYLDELYPHAVNLFNKMVFLVGIERIIDRQQRLLASTYANQILEMFNRLSDVYQNLFIVHVAQYYLSNDMGRIEKAIIKSCNGEEMYLPILQVLNLYSGKDKF